MNLLPKKIQLVLFISFCNILSVDLTGKASNQLEIFDSPAKNSQNSFLEKTIATEFSSSPGSSNISSNHKIRNSSNDYFIEINTCPRIDFPNIPTEISNKEIDISYIALRGKKEEYGIDWFHVALILSEEMYANNPGHWICFEVSPQDNTKIHLIPFLDSTFMDSNPESETNIFTDILMVNNQRNLRNYTQEELLLLINTYLSPAQSGYLLYDPTLDFPEENEHKCAQFVASVLIELEILDYHKPPHAFKSIDFSRDCLRSNKCEVLPCNLEIIPNESFKSFIVKNNHTHVMRFPNFTIADKNLFNDRSNSLKNIQEQILRKKKTSQYLEPHSIRDSDKVYIDPHSCVSLKSISAFQTVNPQKKKRSAWRSIFGSCFGVNS